MDFSNERYVRLYTRDTITWKLIGWEGRFVLMSLMRALDRAGVLDFGEVDPADAVAVMIDAPIEIVRLGLGRCLERSVFELSEGCLVMPKFLDAQEGGQTDRQRQAESRAKRRDVARFVTKRDTLSQNVTNPPDFVTACHNVSLQPNQPVFREDKRMSSHRASTEADAQFDQFWKAYPKKTHKAQALRAWKKLKPGDGLVDQLVSDVKERTRDDVQWIRDAGTAIPNPATYLNNARWNDEWIPKDDPLLIRRPHAQKN